MPWVRIEDTVPDHPKFLRAGPIAAWLWLCGLCYCQRQLTDGFIPKEALPFLGFLLTDDDGDEIGSLVGASRELGGSLVGAHKRRKVGAKREQVGSYVRAPENLVFRYAKKLCRVGLWELKDGGFQIHDYLVYNDSKAVALQRKAALKQIRSDAGKAGAAARWQTGSNGHGKLPSDLPSFRDGKPMPPSLPLPVRTKRRTKEKAWLRTPPSVKM